MRLDCGPCVIRSYREEDVGALAPLANNPNVSRYMSDRFPYPYTHRDAHAWIARCLKPEREEDAFAIEVDGVFAGGIGFQRFAAEHRFTAEIGYWLGEPHWGKEIMNKAVRKFVCWLWEYTDFERIQAHTLAVNQSSQRVLEKAGLQRESIVRRTAFKNGEFHDCPAYALLRPRETSAATL